MLINKSESRNFTATSSVNDVAIMYMSANYNGGNLGFNKNIQNLEAYKENRDEVDADYDTFQNEVIEAIGE